MDLLICRSRSSRLGLPRCPGSGFSRSRFHFWNPKSGVWNLEPRIQNLEPGMYNAEPRSRNRSEETRPDQGFPASMLPNMRFPAVPRPPITMLKRSCPGIYLFWPMILMRVRGGGGGRGRETEGRTGEENYINFWEKWGFFRENVCAKSAHIFANV